MALRDSDRCGGARELARQFELNVNGELSEMSRYAVWLREMLGEGTRDAPLQDAPSHDTRTLVQGSDAWFEARASRLTGSNMAAAVGLSPYATPSSYWEKVTGRLTGIDVNISSAATSHGTENESVAIRAYESLTGHNVCATGLWCHPKISWLGASPDGLIGQDGVLEIKCPVYRIHDSVPKHYMPQVQAEMEMTARSWCDFVSFHITHAKRRESNVGHGANSAASCAATSHAHMRIFRVARSLEYWQWLLPRLKAFWACVHLDEDPRNVPELAIQGLVPPDVSVELLHDEHIDLRCSTRVQTALN